MLKKLLEYFTRLLTLAEATRENKTEIAEMRAEMRDLALTVQLLANNQRHDMEKLALRLENELLKFERRLPPSKHGK
jgi:NTP pyrophosphatase (non-canonical NTP hydrolase)